jgi:predicted DNA-binding antitoxin AbrB/MazE fold protein
MALLKRKVSPEETFQAVYENGVLRPLQPLRLREKSHVTVTLCSDAKWRRDFERLLRRMRARTKTVPQRNIETEVSRARAEVKAKRRAARRLA